MMWRPAERLPVNAMRSIGAATSALPCTSSPIATCSTSGGSTAIRHLAHSSAQSVLSSLGFRITVLPATSAGTTVSLHMRTGKFHGVMQTATPSGA